MSLPSLQILKTWKISDLKRWLKDPSTQEGWGYDFKASLPHSKDNEEKQRMRATYCAFANSKGGIIFYGINDNKNISGLSYDKNFKNRVSDVIAAHIYPPIKEWDLFHTLFTTKNKDMCVYAVLIKESFYTDKPHINDGRIWRRENGHRDYIKSGLDIHKHFFVPEKIYPAYTDVILKVLDGIKSNYQGHIPFLDVIVLQRFMSFLEESCKNDFRRNDYSSILNNFSKLQSKLMTLQKNYATFFNEQGKQWQTDKQEVDDIISTITETLRRLD